MNECLTLGQRGGESPPAFQRTFKTNKRAIKMQEHDREITAESPEFAKWLNNATSEASDAALKAHKKKMLKDCFDYSDFVPLCRTLRFITSIRNEPCRDKSEMVAQAIWRIVKEQTAEFLEALFLDCLVSQGGAEIARNWYWLKPAICAFCRSLTRDIRSYLRTKD